MSKQTTVPSEPIRDARKLGVGKMLVLGIQHMFAMFGYHFGADHYRSERTGYVDLRRPWHLVLPSLHKI